MIPKRILDILATALDETPQLPPTIVFNEGWLLRLILDCFSRLPSVEHELSFPPNTTWFSEAWLPTAFRPRTRADKLSESYTHADGVIGHFKINRASNAALVLAKDSSHFVVTEAKMFSPLSSGVKNAPFFNQAARNVACMAEVVRRADCSIEQFTSLGFYVLAPEVMIDGGVFDSQMTRENVRATVAERVRGYDGLLDTWFESWFLPVLGSIDLKCISWEAILTVIESSGDPGAGELRAFYDNCIKFNRPRDQA